MNKILLDLEKIIHMIEEARKEIATGIFIDLTKINVEIEKICHQITKNPPRDDGTIERQILMIISDLDVLAKDLKNQRN